MLNGSNLNVGVDPNPGKYWLQTSLLPRPQYPVRLSDKTFKTVTNYCRRDGQGSSSSVTEDSGVGSNGETDTLHNLELSDSSPAPQTRFVYFINQNSINFILEEDPLENWTSAWYSLISLSSWTETSAPVRVPRPS